MIRALVLLAALCGLQDARAFEAGRVDFELRFKDLASRHPVITHAVMPGEVLDLELLPIGRGGVIELTSGAAEAMGERGWRFRAPTEPGLSVLEWRRGDHSLRLNLLVMRDAGELRDGMLNGYRIGEYAHTPLRGRDIYAPPAGFIEVTPELLDLPVSPHFTLGQFLCKQEGGFPKYLLLRTRLLLKLEYLLEQVNAAGIPAESFTVMSAYRTPWYNAAIGNRTTYSRHLYGGAADIYIDRSPADGTMDDLDGNGRIDVNDAAVLYRIIDGLIGRAAYRPFVGGLARYRSNAAHGPFIHVDVRGERARWGTTAP